MRIYKEPFIIKGPSGEIILDVMNPERVYTICPVRHFADNGIPSEFTITTSMLKSFKKYLVKMAELNKPSMKKIVKHLYDVISYEKNGITIIFRGKKYYFRRSKSGNIVTENYISNNNAVIILFSLAIFEGIIENVPTVWESIEEIPEIYQLAWNDEAWFVGDE